MKIAQLFDLFVDAANGEDNAAPPTELQEQLSLAGATLCVGVRPPCYRFRPGVVALCAPTDTSGRGLYAWLEYRPPEASAVVLLPEPKPVLEVAA